MLCCAGHLCVHMCIKYCVWGCVCVYVPVHLSIYKETFIMLFRTKKLNIFIADFN